MTGKKSPVAQAEAVLREYALSYPEAREEFPWGERVVKVAGKVFVFLGRAEGGLSMSVKLPGSATLALDLPFASPTAYGLGKSGWVTAAFAAGDRPPVDLLKRWVDESYRAVAPKRLVARLPGGNPDAASFGPVRASKAGDGSRGVTRGARDGSGARGTPGRGPGRGKGGGAGRRSR